MTNFRVIECGGNIRVIFPRTPKKPLTARLSRIITQYYGQEPGDGETDNCLRELVADIKHFCELTGRNPGDFLKGLTIS